MNPIRTGQSEKNEAEKIGGERRSDRRYDIGLDVRWKLIDRRRVLDSGIGKTLDVSSGGLLIETDRELPSGLNIELSIEWPVLLHNLVPLQLVVTGRVVRTREQRVGVRMVQHEFRTVSMPTEPRAELQMIPREGILANASSTGKSH